MRLLSLNMVAIHTTSMTMANVILDLYSSERSADFVDGLREECDRLLAQNGGEWTKAALNDSLRLDSTIRESMRISDLTHLALTRLVGLVSGTIA